MRRFAFYQDRWVPHPARLRVMLLLVPITFTIRGRCYACDGAAVGIRDRRPEGGDVEKACARHADPRLTARHVCMYCGAAVRQGSLTVDGDHAHRACHVDACRDYPRRQPY